MKTRTDHDLARTMQARLINTMDSAGPARIVSAPFDPSAKGYWQKQHDIERRKSSAFAALAIAGVTIFAGGGLVALLIWLNRTTPIFN